MSVDASSHKPRIKSPLGSKMTRSDANKDASRSRPTDNTVDTGGDFSKAYMEQMAGINESRIKKPRF